MDYKANISELGELEIIVNWYYGGDTGSLIRFNNVTRLWDGFYWDSNPEIYYKSHENPAVLIEILEKELT
jgi:hypothetical protein